VGSDSVTPKSAAAGSDKVMTRSGPPAKAIASARIPCARRVEHGVDRAQRADPGGHARAVADRRGSQFAGERFVVLADHVDHRDPTGDRELRGDDADRYPARRARSVGLMPAALTLILICPWPGSGSGTWAHFSTSGGPYPVITIALGMAVSFLAAAGMAANGSVSVVVVRWLLLHRSRRAPAPGPAGAGPRRADYRLSLATYVMCHVTGKRKM